MSNQFFSIGLGIGSQNARGQWLEVYFPQPLHQPSQPLVQAFESVLGSGENRNVQLEREQLDQLVSALEAAGASVQAQVAMSMKTTDRPVVAVMLATDSPPTDVPDAYLKLQLLSHRLVKPHEIDLGGLFGRLPNVAWTSRGPIDPEELPARQLEARLRGEPLSVDSVDKFPKMTDYVVPQGVRIADSARVRLGAWVGEGTTVMHEGFINFNAGTEGPGMIEGRISAGVMVGAGSDLGGSSSTMGTLSGGGNIVISLGRECLLGANAGVGIPLGDRCTVEAGLYITSGTRVTMLDENREPAGQVKARELAGRSDLLFRRNSVSGAVECLTNRSAVQLNEELHAHN